jgi:hypothetical protein
MASAAFPPAPKVGGVPNQCGKVATIQLATPDQVHVFHVVFEPTLPSPLLKLLSSKTVVFAGHNVVQDRTRLCSDYNCPHALPKITDSMTDAKRILR